MQGAYLAISQPSFVNARVVPGEEWHYAIYQHLTSEIVLSNDSSVRIHNNFWCKAFVLVVGRRL